MERCPSPDWSIIGAANKLAHNLHLAVYRHTIKISFTTNIHKGRWSQGPSSTFLFAQLGSLGAIMIPTERRCHEPAVTQAHMVHCPRRVPSGHSQRHNHSAQPLYTEHRCDQLGTDVPVDEPASESFNVHLNSHGASGIHISQGSSLWSQWNTYRWSPQIRCHTMVCSS